MKTSTATTLAMLAGTCLLAACTDTPSSDLPAGRSSCTPAPFGPPFTAVDPCSGEAVMGAATETMFAYRPAEGLDRRRAFDAAIPLLEPGFARAAAPAAVALAPVTAAVWRHWQDARVTVAAAVRVTNDDHPPDTGTRMARTLAVTLTPSDGTSVLGLVVFAVASRVQSARGTRWLLANAQVAS